MSTRTRLASAIAIPAVTLLMLLVTRWAMALTVTDQVWFQEVSASAGITHAGMSWGSAWGDFNGDDLPDLWVGNHDAPPSLYINQGDGSFADWSAVVPFDADEHGAAWADFDNDGDQDLVVEVGAVGGVGSGSNFLLVNTGGAFVDQAAEMGVDYPLGRGRTPRWIDADNDGRLDLILTTAARPDGQAPTVLFQQTVTGFQDISASAGFTATATSQFAQMVDLTGNGEPELILHGWPYPQRVYGIKSLPFIDLTSEIGLPTTCKAEDVVLADFDGDQLVDIFLARGASRPDAVQVSEHEIRVKLSAKNTELGISFETGGEVTFDLYGDWKYLDLNTVFIGASGYHPPDPIFTLSPTDPAVIGIYDHTPGIDNGIYIGYDPPTQTWHLLCSGLEPCKMQGVITTTMPVLEMAAIGFDPDVAPPEDRLLRQSVEGFSDWTLPAGLDFPTECHSGVAGDFDNDMDLDIYLVCSRPVANLPNILYENQGDGTFVAVPDAGGAAGSPDGVGDSVTVADYDGDGFLDLFVTNGRGPFPFNNGPNQLFRNQGNSNHWLEVDLVGTTSNRDGIGATVWVTAGGITQVREQSGGTHNKAQNHQRLHFGLGGNTSVGEIVVRWPSGYRQALYNVSADQVIQIEEDDDPPSVAFDSTTYSVSEVEKEAVITVTLSRSVALTVSVDCVMLGGTATAGDDYVPVSSTLTLAPETVALTFTVAITSDCLVEETETVTLSLTDASNAMVGSNNPAVLTITDSSQQWLLPFILRGHAHAPPSGEWPLSAQGQFPGSGKKENRLDPAQAMNQEAIWPSTTNPIET